MTGVNGNQSTNNNEYYKNKHIVDTLNGFRCIGQSFDFDQYFPHAKLKSIAVNVYQ